MLSIFVFILSHEQASTERGFNVNGEVLIENLAEESMISQRLVYDQLKVTEKKMHEIMIPRELVVSCKGARQRYMASLKEKQESAADTAISRKRKLKLEEVLSVKRRKMEVEKVTESLKSDIEKSSVEASAKETFEAMKLCLKKANSFRDVLKKKEETVEELQEAIRKLEKELNN